MLGAVAVAVGTPIALTGGPPAHALTCASPDSAVGYACSATFYVVGSVCRGQLPTKLPLPGISLNAAQSINLCPPLG